MAKHPLPLREGKSCSRQLVRTFQKIALSCLADLGETKKGPGPNTVFAPTDAAFVNVPPDQPKALLADRASGGEPVNAEGWCAAYGKKS